MTDRGGKNIGSARTSLAQKTSTDSSVDDLDAQDFNFKTIAG